VARPPHPVGTSGNIRSYRTASGWRSRTTVRDYDGTTREIERAGRTKPNASWRRPSRRPPAAGRCDGRCEDLAPGPVIRSSFACCLRRMVATLGGVSVGVSGCEVPPVGWPPPTRWITRARLLPLGPAACARRSVVLQEQPQGLATSVSKLPVLHEVGEVAALHGDLDGDQVESGVLRGLDAQ